MVCRSDGPDDFDDLSDILSCAIKYTCSFAGCGLQFKRKDRLDSHEYTHSRIPKFHCTEDGCHKAYANNAHLQRHKRTAHDKTAPKQLLYCTAADCMAYFDSTAKLKNHLLKVHAGVQREFICDLCDLAFRRKAKLRLHMFSHTGDYRYRCDVCERGFLQLGHLTRHEKTHAERRCDRCDDVFTKWSLLLAHKRTAHADTGDNKCGMCDKVFRTKRNLKHHSRVHEEADERIVHQCTVDGCPKFFFKRSSMLAHFRSAHENQKFACTVDGCGQQLSTKQKLNQHVKVMHLEGGDSARAKVTSKSKANRAKRKDKGVQKVSTASKLFDVVLPTEFERAIIEGNGSQITFFYGRTHDDCDANDLSAGLSCAESSRSDGNHITEEIDAIEC